MLDLTQPGPAFFLLGVGVVLFAALAQVLTQPKRVPCQRATPDAAPPLEARIPGGLDPKERPDAFAAGYRAFMVAAFVSVGGVLLILALISSTMPTYKEAYEGIGDAIQLFFFGGCALIVALIVSISVGVATSVRINKQFALTDNLQPTSSPPPSSAERSDPARHGGSA